MGTVCETGKLIPILQNQVCVRLSLKEICCSAKVWLMIIACWRGGSTMLSCGAEHSLEKELASCGTVLTLFSTVFWVRSS